MSFLQLYLITRLDVLSESFTLMVVFGILACAFSAVAYIISRADKVEWLYPKAQMCVVLFAMIVCVGAIGKVLTPTTKDVLLIYTGSYLTNSDEAKSVPENILKTINKLMEDYLDDGKAHDTPQEGRE